MHTDGEDDDDEEPPIKTRARSYETNEQTFNLSAVSTMSTTPGQAFGVLSPTPPMGRTSGSSTPPVISLLTDDEESGQDSNTNEREHTTFPLSSADDVRQRFALGVQESPSDNVNNAKTKTRDNDNDESDEGDNSDDAGDLEG